MTCDGAGTSKADDGGHAELRYFEAEQDLQEVKRLLKYVRRNNVKNELNSSIKKFQSVLDFLKPAVNTDPYKFTEDSSGSKGQ